MGLRGARNYLETQIRTATKEQLLLMLYDGAIRFSEQAKAKIEEKDIEGSYNLLIKGQNIIVELMCALDRGVGEELYQNLMSLYNFIYSRLVEANIKKEVPMVEEALTILHQLRDTWSEAIEQNRCAETGDAPSADEPRKVVGGPVVPGYTRQQPEPNTRTINVRG